MIELIFVIVVLGVLAAVAVPRFLALEDQTQDMVVKSFAGTMYRTIGHSFWAKSLSSGADGSIKADNDGDNSKFYGKPLGEYVDIPEYLNASTVDFSQCVKDTGIAQPFLQKGLSGRYNIFCRDGNVTTAPMFVASKSDTYAF